MHLNFFHRASLCKYYVNNGDGSNFKSVFSLWFSNYSQQTLSLPFMFLHVDSLLVCCIFRLQVSSLGSGWSSTSRQEGPRTAPTWWRRWPATSPAALTGSWWDWTSASRVKRSHVALELSWLRSAVSTAVVSREGRCDFQKHIHETQHRFICIYNNCSEIYLYVDRFIQLSINGWLDWWIDLVVFFFQQTTSYWQEKQLSRPSFLLQFLYSDWLVAFKSCGTNVLVCAFTVLH